MGVNLIQKILLVAIFTVIIPITFHLKNTPNQLIPFPYTLSSPPTQDVTAPVLIIGDRMAQKLATFKKLLADTISTELSKPIEIDSLTYSMEGLHRTLNRLKNLKKFPKIIIYTGASQEEWEYRFITQEIPIILENFKNYENPKLQTLLILFPFLSKFIFNPIKQIDLPHEIVLDPNEYKEQELFKRIELHYKLYENELKELISLVQEKNSILIMLTTPINPNTKPKKVCEGSIDPELKKKLAEVIKLVKEKDFKSAYEKAKILHYIAIGNAQVQYIFSRIARKFRKKEEAYYALDLASSYDCKRWRANGVYNSIIRKLAKNEDIFLHDFDAYIRDNWEKNVTFFDDIYPQNIYYENTTKAIGLLIKRVLKL